MSVYDTLGLVNHFKIKGIIILQRRWIAGIGWDEELTPDIYAAWKLWLSKLKEIHLVQVTRCYHPDLLSRSIIRQVEVHTFVDASQEAFSAVTYLRVEMRNGNITTTLFGAEARVAPLKKLTIPKLDLRGCVLGTRFAVLLRSELRLPKVDRKVFCSDSKTVLAWIGSEAGRYKEFVANRVCEIQEATKGTDWRWVPTNENSADIATRFETQISFEPTDMLYTGPEFLKRPEEEWPKEAKGKDLGIILATRMLKLGDDSRVSPSSDVECGRNSGKLIKKISQRLLPENKFETLPDIERCVMVVWKATKLWRDKTQRKRPRLHRPLTRLLNLEDSLNRLVCRAAAVQKAARFWYKKTFHKSGELNQPWKAAMENNKARQHSFTASPEEYRSAVTTLGRIVKKAKIARLSPCLINGTICLKGRILQANKIPAKQKTPAILPSDHHVTELLIQADHERCAHQGSETLLNNLRGRFWIIDGRQTVLRTIRKCPRCRFSRASLVITEMGQLPHYRLAAYQRPFTFTGLDTFRPFTVTVGRRHEKRWVIIFKCLVTRAIHLEVMHALSTDEFIMGLSRFIDTRGRPGTIYSDNGTNFVGASKERKLAASEIDFEVVAASGRFGPVKWKFNPPAAPHFGGAWERLIKSVKKCLRATLNEVNPKDTTLHTALKSAENVINSRPLTYVSSDPTGEDSLTPIHFLLGDNDAGPSIPKFIEANNCDLREQWKRAQQLTNEFWINWTRDYIPKLMTRGKWHHQTEPIRTEDLVFLVDELHPRNMWKRGFVSDVHFGPDGQVRVATIITKQNGKAVFTMTLRSHMVHALTLRFGDDNLQPYHVVKLKNNRQKRDKTLQELAADVERLARLAFPDCPRHVQDLLAHQNFMDAIEDPECQQSVRMSDARTLQEALIHALKFEEARDATRGYQKVLRLMKADESQEDGDIKGAISQLQRTVEEMKKVCLSQNQPQGPIASAPTDPKIKRYAGTVGGSNELATEGLVNGVSCRMVIDSGANIGNNLFSHLGYLADIKDDYLIGLDVLRKFGLSIDFQENVLKIAGEEIPLVGSRSSATNKVLKKLTRLLYQEENVFAISPNDVGRTNVTQHRIDTGGASPVKQLPRRLSMTRRNEVDKLIEELTEQDVIERSSSPWASPVVLVKKKDGSTRFCVDYRRLNDLTKKNSYPLPRIDARLDTLSGSQWFSTLDLKSGYCQFSIHPEDREMTAFTAETGFGNPRAMDKLKQALSPPPILVYPDPGEQFILDKDASNTGIGAVLFQTQDGVERVIAYFRLAGTSRKGPRTRSKTKLKTYNLGAPFERIAIDIMGQLPRSDKGNRYILVAMDYFTKWPEAFPLADQEAETVAETLISQFFSRFGVPMQIHTDQGRNFESRLFAQMCKLLGSHKTRTTPLHPQSDGMVEKFNRTLASQLSLFVAQSLRDWDSQLPILLMAYRSSVHETTGYSPAKMLLGKELKLPFDIFFGCPNSIGEGSDEFVDRLHSRLEKVHRWAREKLKIASEAMKVRYDTQACGNDLQEGGLVWLYNPKRKKGLSPKLKDPGQAHFEL
ncbi:hypothetical protein LAZ67_9002385 [Cordylochernes scorpioides]|uniref:Integrase catalytic domain-containing protein n=1 Tax=Cordylochernes scorpioides TaxID=51811 RepID=A0ABY6KTU0_9ARAC|nr:hypothetical protein LAZ67_9002385 [Cordylochernes scorpioides]